MTRSYTPSQIGGGILAGEFTRGSAFVPLAEVERLTRERDEARAEVERLTRERDEARYFLKIFVHAHANNNAVPPHIEEQARKALEVKP